MVHAEQLEKVHALLNTVCEIVAEEPNGVPSGVLYAGLMQYGCTLNAYEMLLTILKSAGRIEERHNVLHYIRPS